jgi:hypothetical protein
MKRWMIAVVAIVVVAVGVGGFFGGRATGGGGGTPTPEQAIAALKNLTPQELQQALQSSGGLGSLFGGRGGFGGTGGTGGTGPTGGNRGGGFVSGSIMAEDSNSITVKLADGSTKIVLYSGSTNINVSQAGSAADLVVGKDVTITGTANTDGSVTATRIQMGTLAGFNGATTSTTGG